MANPLSCVGKIILHCFLSCIVGIINVFLMCLDWNTMPITFLLIVSDCGKIVELERILNVIWFVLIHYFPWCRKWNPSKFHIYPRQWKKLVTKGTNLNPISQIRKLRISQCFQVLFMLCNTCLLLYCQRWLFIATGKWTGLLVTLGLATAYWYPDMWPCAWLGSCSQRWSTVPKTANNRLELRFVAS